MLEQLKRFSREPFTELLADWLRCAPDLADVAAFARRNPDKYVNAIHHLSSLAGFSDKREMDVNVNFNPRDLSDSQLEDRLLEMQKMLDLQAEEVEEAAIEDGGGESSS